MSLHHVGIELVPGDVDRAVKLFQLLGFVRVEPPPSLARYTWLERGGSQVHLMPEPNPTVAPRGHLAIVAEDFDATCERVAAAGFRVEPRRAHWGAARAWITAPGGHQVEIMAAPPS